MPQVQLQSTEHRIALVDQWDIKPGSKVLEVGCGQGDCTVVLATAVGDTGHVTAIDPGAPDYGSPYTLAQAQEHISNSPVGSRITFIRTTPIKHLAALQPNAYPYDYAVLAHSLWYFSSPEEISETLSVLAKYAKEICIAEWSLAPSKNYPTESYPHVLAAFAMGFLAVRQPIGTSTSNIQTLISPAGIKELTGVLSCVKETFITPKETVLDGKWEVDWVLSKGWENQVNSALEQDAQNQRDRGTLLAMRDAVRLSLPNAPLTRGVRCMMSGVPSSSQFID